MDRGCPALSRAYWQKNGESHKTHNFISAKCSCFPFCQIGVLQTLTAYHQHIPRFHPFTMSTTASGDGAGAGNNDNGDGRRHPPKPSPYMASFLGDRKLRSTQRPTTLNLENPANPAIRLPGQTILPPRFGQPTDRGLGLNTYTTHATRSDSRGAAYVTTSPSKTPGVAASPLPPQPPTRLRGSRMTLTEDDPEDEEGSGSDQPTPARKSAGKRKRDEAVESDDNDGPKA